MIKVAGTMTTVNSYYTHPLVMTIITQTHASRFTCISSSEVRSLIWDGQNLVIIFIYVYGLIVCSPTQVFQRSGRPLYEICASTMGVLAFTGCTIKRR
jgi:hypothetical protein